MAKRSMGMRELNSRGIYLSERGQTGSSDRKVNARMLAAMRNEGLSAAEAFKKVLSEDRDLSERYHRTHGKPLTLCDNPSDGNALADFISVDRYGIERSSARQSGRFWGIGE